MPPARGSAPGLITFTSDFGDGWYAGAMKGAALKVNPRVAVIDLTHGISAMNVLEGAFALAAGCDAFPDGAVHVAVVDPGVGTSRRGVVVETDRFHFVGPDNGLLSLAAPPSRIERAFVLKNPRFFRTSPSATFHGRDIFAPVAAHLTLGVDAAEMGPLAGAIEQLGLPEVRVGLIPDVGGTTRLMRTIGPAWAKELILTGRLATAEEARAMGLVHYVADEGDLIPRARALLEAIGKNAPLAVGVAKRLIDRAQGLDKQSGLELEAMGQSTLLTTEDFREGAAALLERREPKFKGR